MSEVYGVSEFQSFASKKHHRWMWGWQKWLAVVELVNRIWPRNA